MQSHHKKGNSLNEENIMKKIEAVIRTAKRGEVCSALSQVGCPGMMISEIEGHGRQKGIVQEFRGKKYTTEFLTKAKIEIVATDQDVDKIVKAIREAAMTGKEGDGKIFVYTIDDAIQIRTGEKGSTAIG